MRLFHVSEGRRIVGRAGSMSALSPSPEGDRKRSGVSGADPVTGQAGAGARDLAGTVLPFYSAARALSPVSLPGKAGGICSPGENAVVGGFYSLGGVVDRLARFYRDLDLVAQRGFFLSCRSPCGQKNAPVCYRGVFRKWTWKVCLLCGSSFRLTHFALTFERRALFHLQAHRINGAGDH